MANQEKNIACKGLADSLSRLIEVSGVDTGAPQREGRNEEGAQRADAGTTERL